MTASVTVVHRPAGRIVSDLPSVRVATGDSDNSTACLADAISTHCLQHHWIRNRPAEHHCLDAAAAVTSGSV